MLGKLRDEVVLLEAACHRLLADSHAPLLSHALTSALASFRPNPGECAPPFIRGLARRSAAQSELLLAACQGGNNEAINRKLGELCEALRDLRESIDKASPGSH
jgi:hypothetical protein